MNMSDIWKDPMVKEALKEGRQPEDIGILRCPECGEFRYYNQGSSFYCDPCDALFYVCSEDEDAPEIGRYVRLDGFMSLADTVDCDDGP